MMHQAIILVTAQDAQHFANVLQAVDQTSMSHTSDAHIDAQHLQSRTRIYRRALRQWLRITHQLTQREIDVVVYRLRVGGTKQQVAHNMGLSFNTVHTYLGRIYKKMHVHGWWEVVAAANQFCELKQYMK